MLKRFADTFFVARNQEIYPSVSNKLDVSTGSLEQVNTAAFNAGDLSTNYTVSNPWMMDQIPPLDASIVAVNEYGTAATMRIYGIEILNEGSGFSIDDIVIENQMTYVARTILPWQKLGTWGSVTDTTLSGSATFNPA